MKTGGESLQLSCRTYQVTLSPSLGLLTDKRINATIAVSGLEVYT